MARYEKIFNKDYSTILDAVNEIIRDIEMHEDLIDEDYSEIGDKNTALRVYEKYFLRNNSYASLTVSIVGDLNETRVLAIGAAGGTGLLNFSLGAENSLVKKFGKEMDKLNF